MPWTPTKSVLAKLYRGKYMYVLTLTLIFSGGVDITDVGQLARSYRCSKTSISIPIKCKCNCQGIGRSLKNDMTLMIIGGVDTTNPVQQGGTRGGDEGLARPRSKY